jgi:hypothetical protein
VPEGQEQAEKLRGDVEAQHGGANASGAQHDRPAHGQDGGFLATSPFGQFCDHAAGVLLGNSRSVTFIMALINSTIQILIYVFSLSTIINNYDPELHKNNYPQVGLRLFMLEYNVISSMCVCVCVSCVLQYLMHHLGYFNYMVFHCLFTGAMSWAVLHLCLYICRSFFRLCTNALLSSPEVPGTAGHTHTHTPVFAPSTQLRNKR